MNYHTLFFQKLGKMSQNLSSAAVLIGALRVKSEYSVISQDILNLYTMSNLAITYPAFLTNFFAHLIN